MKEEIALMIFLDNINKIRGVAPLFKILSILI